MFVNDTLSANGLRIFKVFLKNNTIIAASEDGLGYAFNSSVSFSNYEIFVSEKWFNRQLSELENLDKFDHLIILGLVPRGMH